MKKTLMALILAISSCVSIPKSCPSKEEELRAGIYMYNVLKTTYSDNLYDVKITRSLYERTKDDYFGCCKEKEQIRRHQHEALYRALLYTGISKQEMDGIIFRRDVIEDDLTIRKECN